MARQGLDDECVMLNACRKEVLAGAMVASTAGLATYRCVSICSEDGSMEDGGDGPCGGSMWCPLRVRRTGSPGIVAWMGYPALDVSFGAMSVWY